MTPGQIIYRPHTNLMFKALLVDDDQRDSDVLTLLLNKYCNDDIVITGYGAAVDESYRLILEKKPDIVFLDVELGVETGFDLLRRFSNFSFRVIFITAHDRYAIQAIKFNALDYVLKPVEIAELVRAVEKVKHAEKISVDAELKNMIHNLAHPHEKGNRIAIPVLNGYRMVPVKDILFCEASKEYTNIHCISGEMVCSSENLGEYDELLTGYGFFRVHHSFLVNKEHVRQYIKGEGGELLLDKNIIVPVSRRKKNEVMDWLTDL